MSGTIQRHPLDYLVSAAALRRKGQVDEAIDEVSAAIAFILENCRDLKGDKLRKKYSFVVAMFEEYSDVKIPAEYIGYLMQCARLRYEIMSGCRSKTEAKQALQDFELMQRACESKVLWSKRNPNDGLAGL